MSAVEFFTYASDGQEQMRDFFSQLVTFDLGKGRIVAETFAMSIQGISESEFEDTILPLSRIPGVNALIFAGLFYVFRTYGRR